jgi:hypothetical protein
MDLAARTTASPTAIWVIVIVMTFCTAILVSAAGIADSRQARASRRKAGIFSLESTPASHTSATNEDAGTAQTVARHRAAREAAADPAAGHAVPGKAVPAQRSPDEERAAQADRG